MKSIYNVGCNCALIVIFVGVWIYCIANYGFLLGVGLGWLPSAIVAFLSAWLWPIAVLAAGALIAYLTGAEKGLILYVGVMAIIIVAMLPNPTKAN